MGRSWPAQKMRKMPAHHSKPVNPDKEAKEKELRGRFVAFLEHFIELTGTDVSYPVQKLKKKRDEEAGIVTADDEQEKGSDDEDDNQQFGGRNRFGRKKPARRNQRKKRFNYGGSDDEDDDEDEDAKAKELLGEKTPDYASGVGLFTALHFLVSQDDDLDVIKMLVKHKANLNAKTHDTELTPLLIAMRDQKPKVWPILIEAGADINAADKDLNTPLHYTVSLCVSPFPPPLLPKKQSCVTNVLYLFSSQRGQMDLMVDLLKRRAKVNAADKSGRLPIHVALQLKQNQVPGYLSNCVA